MITGGVAGVPLSRKNYRWCGAEDAKRRSRFEGRRSDDGITDSSKQVHLMHGARRCGSSCNARIFAVGSLSQFYLSIQRFESSKICTLQRMVSFLACAIEGAVQLMRSQTADWHLGQELWIIGGTFLFRDGGNKLDTFA